MLPPISTHSPLVIFTVALSDLLYGCFVSPFLVENYVRNNWEQGTVFCSFYTFFFTFHDLFAPLCLIVLSIYISLKFTGAPSPLPHSLCHLARDKKENSSFDTTKCVYTRGSSNPPGVTAELKHKRVIYACLCLGVVVVSLLLAIPATLHVSGWLGMVGLAECHIHVLYSVCFIFYVQEKGFNLVH